ncbi:class I SAM-dependent methyltransferase [Neptuniibacter sp. QD48_55]|uniref:class I SAM-dependent methyltransferase n=1 Tax=Neptuniibacter sp. QD48_55 TaxID=3398212 RepID=UPI0039F50C3D
MQRESIFSGELEELISYDWPLPDIGQHSISFGICKLSGLIMQKHTVNPSFMEQYYRSIATYINPSASGKPTTAKVNDLDRLIDITQRGIGNIPKRVFQIGSSDGYTLHRFREAGAIDILGVDPGERSIEFAKEQYNIPCIRGNVETTNIEGLFDLCVLTHVLEHLYDPHICLEKVKSNLDTQNGYILVEVPLWERADVQPLGVFAFEHLNYFCEHSLLKLLNNSGFETLHISKNYYINHYPVITVLAKVSQQPLILESKSNYSKNLAIAKAYLEREMDFWNDTNSILSSAIDPDYPCYIYGGGIHTSQLIAHTPLGTEIAIESVIDSSPNKWGSKIGNYSIKSPECLNEIPTGSNIIISSLGWQEDIKNYVVSIRTDLNIITLH